MINPIPGQCLLCLTFNLDIWDAYHNVPIHIDVRFNSEALLLTTAV